MSNMIEASCVYKQKAPKLVEKNRTKAKLSKFTKILFKNKFRATPKGVFILRGRDTKHCRATKTLWVLDVEKQDGKNRPEHQYGIIKTFMYRKPNPD